mmetsp:Transcript_18975/g.28648  ORF Transcript_18975/g.28648 Transcript_18975/m.28648 type:complete len:208 (-) Transcript_18975:22-645(-)
MAGPAAEHSRKIKGAAVGRRRRSVVRTMMRTMSMRETSTTSATSRAATATAATSSRPLRTSAAVVLLRSNFLRVRDVQSLLRRAAFSAGSFVWLLALLIASARVGGVLAGEPRTPDEAIGLGRWWRTTRTPMAGMRAGSTRSSKGETGHERGKGSLGLVVNATAGSLVGIKLLDKVPEVHVVRILWWTHDECVCILSKLLVGRYVVK